MTSVVTKGGVPLSQNDQLDYSSYFWQGRKVRLRPLRIEDAEQAFAGSLDTPTRQALQAGVELPTSLEALRDSTAKYRDCRDVDGLVVFAIENLAGSRVGNISWHSRRPKNGTFRFGVSVDRAHRRQGYAEDAVRILLRYAFYEGRFQKCDSACVHTNEGSIALHRKLGFVAEGRLRREVYMNGQHHDELLWGLTREEFDANEAAHGHSAGRGEGP